MFKKLAILAALGAAFLTVAPAARADDGPKTKTMAGVMKALKINRTCLLTLAHRDRNIYLSSRNLPDVTVRIEAELNAFDVATRRKMLVTSDAMSALMAQEAANA